MPRPERPRGPTFIGVGPEKTGTTWIHSNLKAHPKVVVPPLKELRYFWEHANFPDESVLRRLTNKSGHRNQYRNYFLRSLKRYSRNPARLFMISRLLWDCRYLFLQHNDEWYLACFESKDGFVCGEISPQYFFLEGGEIKHIHDLLPDVKIVISLREPSDWLWSLFRMVKRNHPEFSDDAFDTLLRDYRTAYSFSKAFRSWKQHFPDEQLLVVFYDELCSSPWQFYGKICRFLGIEPDPARLPELAKRINPGNEEKLADERRNKIQDAWRDDIEQLARMLPTLPESWHKKSLVSA